MAEIITLVKYQDGQLSIEVFKTLAKARKTMTKDYRKCMDFYYYDDLDLITQKDKDSEISEDYAYVYVADNTHTIWEIFAIQV